MNDLFHDIYYPFYLTVFHLIFLSWLRQSLGSKHTLFPAGFPSFHNASNHTKRYFPSLQARSGRQLYFLHQSPRESRMGSKE